MKFGKKPGIADQFTGLLFKARAHDSKTALVELIPGTLEEDWQEVLNLEEFDALWVVTDEICKRVPITCPPGQLWVMVRNDEGWRWGVIMTEGDSPSFLQVFCSSPVEAEVGGEAFLQLLVTVCNWAMHQPRSDWKKFGFENKTKIVQFDLRQEVSV